MHAYIHEFQHADDLYGCNKPHADVNGYIQNARFTVMSNSGETFYRQVFMAYSDPVYCVKFIILLYLLVTIQAVLLPTECYVFVCI